MFLSIIIIRSLILYVLVIFAVRLMGKRQLGELQPSELVITILVSNIATLPVEDVSIPVIVGVTPILALVCFEVIMSRLILKFPGLRKLISGSPKVVISNGKIDCHTLGELRLSVDDVMTALRGNNVFDISEVQFAMVETTGGFSVMKKQNRDTPVRDDITVKAECADPPMPVAADGKILENAANALGVGKDMIDAVLKRAGKPIEKVLLMTSDASGKIYIAWKDGSEPYTEQKNDKS